MSGSATLGDIWTEFVATRRSELRNQLISTYIPLVRFVVVRLGIPPTSLLETDDLVSYGTIGLINAIDRFDPSRGVRFEAFASARIRGAVIDQLRSLNWLSRTAVRRVRCIESVLAKLEQRLGRPANEVEAAVEMGISTDRYRQILLEVSVTVLSLDAPLGLSAQDDGVTSLADLLEDQDMLGPAEEVEQRELVVSLSAAIDQLPARERLLLSLYYQEELTMKEISKVLGVSESRVCQLHIQAILHLRAAMNVYQESKEAEHAQVLATAKRPRHRVRSLQ